MASNIQLAQGLTLLNTKKEKIINSNLIYIENLNDPLVSCNTNDCKPRYAYCPNKFPPLDNFNKILSTWGNTYKGYMENKLLN